MPKLNLVLLSLAIVGFPCHGLAQDALDSDQGPWRWDELEKRRRIVGGSVLPPEQEQGQPFHRLRVERGSEPSVTVLTIERPKVAGARYAVTGQIRYERVDVDGYLEMWSHFPDGSEYFSRTLAESGPMMKLHGTSGWRSFTLPFDATGAPPPTRLIVNVVLPGRGVVYLGPMRLGDGGGGSADFAGAFGGIAGALIGSLGAMIGILTSLGKARRVVTVAARALIAGGAVAMVVGLVAAGQGRSYAVYFPLLLSGFLATAIPIGLMPTIRKRYEEIELRAMSARDLA